MDIQRLLKPSKTALLVIDKQAGYFDSRFMPGRNRSLPDNAAEILEKIDVFIEQARSAGVEVIWTKMIEDIELSPDTIAEKMKGDPDNVMSITRPGSASFEISGRIQPLPTEKVIVKKRYNAFSQTNLADILEEKGVTTVLLIGGYASRCVLATVAGANGEDLFCIIPRGLVINQTNAQAEVEVVYNIVNAIFGATLNVQEITAAWEL